jgi:hypothetical protein
MKKRNEIIKERMQNIIDGGSGVNLQSLITVLKSDLRFVLSSYMALDGSEPQIIIDADGGGVFTFTIKATTDRLLDYGRLAPLD